jgi:hypothetical protein
MGEPELPTADFRAGAIHLRAVWTPRRPDLEVLKAAGVTIVAPIHGVRRPFDTRSAG